MYKMVTFSVWPRYTVIHPDFLTFTPHHMTHTPGTRATVNWCNYPVIFKAIIPPDSTIVHVAVHTEEHYIEIIYNSQTLL